MTGAAASPLARLLKTLAGVEPGEVWGEAFQRVIETDTKRYAEIVQRAGIQPE